MTSRRSQLQEDTYFRVLRMLQDNPDLTQREIAERLGVSTSGLNYCLNALIDKGWVKVQNFSQSKNKFGYIYVSFTQSGDSARRMSRLRSPIPMLAMTPDTGTYNRMALSWGVEPMLTAFVNHTDEMVMQVDTLLIESKRVNIGDLVLIVAGSPPGIPGSINAMRVHKIGDAVGGAAPAYRK